MIPSRSIVVVSMAVLALSSTGCSARFRSARHFAGPLKSSAAACPPTTANLLLRGGNAVFSPAETTWVLSGHVADDRIEATRSRPGIDHTTYATTLNATVVGSGVSGVYQTPTCTYEVRLSEY